VEYLLGGKVKNMKIKLFESSSEDSSFIKDIISSLLIESGFYITESNKFDIGIAIGGDGTFLHMVMETDFNPNSLFIGINNGTLGFLQEIKPNEIKKFIKNLEKKKYKIEELSFEEILVTHNGKKDKYKSLNEVVVREKDLKTAYFDVLIDNELLENFVGDGVMVSTPTGSTSYNLSGGGAIIYNGIHALEITPLAPINNYVYRTLTNSIIIPDFKTINIVPVKRTKSVNLFIDGRLYTYSSLDKIEMNLAKDKIKVIRMNEYDYTKIINNKFLK